MPRTVSLCWLAAFSLQMCDCADRYLKHKQFELYKPTTGDVWYTNQPVKGINFNGAGQFLIWQEASPQVFADLYWTYTYNSKRGCKVRLSGSHIELHEHDSNWKPVVESMTTEAANYGTYVATDKQMNGGYSNEPYQFWKLEFVSNTAHHGPLMGCVAVRADGFKAGPNPQKDGACYFPPPTSAPTAPPPTTAPTTAPPTRAPTTRAPTTPTATPTSYPTRTPTLTPTFSPTLSPTSFFDLEGSEAALDAAHPYNWKHHINQGKPRG